MKKPEKSLIAAAKKPKEPLPEAAREPEAAKEQPPVQKPAKKPPRPVPPRLPSSSIIEAIYNGEAVEWNGNLSVPHEGTRKVFTGKARTLFGLCSWLDRQYRKWEKEQA